MKSFMKNQLGFGSVMVLGVVVAVVVIVVGGLVLHDHNHKKSTNDLNSSETQTASSQKSSLTSGSQSAQAAQQYLTIKEWGIQLPLSNSIQDAYYVVSASSQDSSGQPNTVWVGLTSLNNKGCNATLANQGQNTQLGAILRVSPTGSDPVSGTPYTTLYPNGKTIGNYYYVYKSSTQNKTCTSQSSLQTIDSAFVTSIKSASSTK